MAEDDEIYQIPQWTEIGNQTGLDPLGMMRPSELIYQPLLAGISTITNRLRYYSFLPWVCHFYAKEYADTNLDEFRKFLRHAESLYALIGYVGTVDRGLTGSNWASRFLSANKDSQTLEFGESARKLKNGFLNNQSGALGAIYGAQIAEMGLIRKADGHDIMVPTDLGIEMASAFEKVLGPHHSVFVKAIRNGRIERTELEALSFLRPSEIKTGTTEWGLLKKSLFGLDAFESDRSSLRKGSLKRMLDYVSITKAWPSPDTMRWAWYLQDFKTENPDKWLVYHMNDLLKFGYEAVFKYALDMMKSSPGETLSWQALLSKIIEPLDEVEGDFLEGVSLDGSENDQVTSLMKMGDATAQLSDEICQTAIKLIRKTLHWASAHKDILQDSFRHDNYFQSLRTELDFISSLETQETNSVMTEVVSERILKRHLWVAARKFRSDSKYTFLFEPVESALRYKDGLGVWMGYPRIAPAIQYLADLSLISKGEGLTDLGRDVLQSL